MKSLFPRNGLPNWFRKLSERQPAVIAYLGGSITRAGGYRVMTTDWLREQYPDAGITAVNAGISGTGSDLGCARLKHDVLRHNPDLVVVEFVVNDGGAAESKARIEGIVQQIRKHDRLADILFVYTLTERDVAGFQAGAYQPGALLQEEVAEYYGIPSIHLGVTVSEMAAAGKLVFTARGPVPPGTIAFTTDSVHPTVPEGHRIYTDTIVSSLKEMQSDVAVKEHDLPPKPLVPGNPWEYARMVPLESSAKFTTGWSFKTPEQFALAREYEWLFPGLWRADRPGESVTVKFNGTRIGLFDIGGPDSGRLKVTVDGGEPFVVDRFTPHNDHDRNEYFYLPELPNGTHTVKFELDAEKTDKRAVFERSGKQAAVEHYDLNRERYDRSVVQIGKLLLVQPPIEP